MFRPLIILRHCSPSDHFLSFYLQHSGSLPTPSSDRKTFADKINALRDPANLDTENFDEAIAALGQNLWRPISSGRKIPADVEALFNDPACDTVTAKVSGRYANSHNQASFADALTYLVS